MTDNPTFKNIADALVYQLSGGKTTNDTRFNKRQIVFQGRIMLDSLLRLEIYNHWREGEERTVAGRYVAVYDNLPIQVRGRKKWVTIPVSYITLPRQQGIQRVYYTGYPYQDFMRRNNHTASARIESSIATQDQTYYVVGNEAIFDRPDVDEDVDKPTISMELVVSVPSADDWNTPLPVSPELLDQLMKGLYERFSQTMPHDVVDDDNDVNAQPPRA